MIPRIGIPALAAARLLSQAVPFSDISLSKTKAILGQPIDVSRDEESYDNDEDLDGTNRKPSSRYARGQRRRRSSSLRRYNEEREILLKQASTFRDFENLCVAMDALEDWRMLADQ